MSTQHDAVTSLSEFWRTLAIVAIGFGLVLALSWSIDAEFPRESAGASSPTQASAAA